MISQHWVRQWLGAVRQQATAWANVDSDLCHHMASLGHNELTHLYQHQDNYDSGDDDSTAPCRMKTHIWVLAEFTLKIILLGFIVVICEYVLKQTFICQLFSSAGWEELTHPPPPPWQNGGKIADPNSKCNFVNETWFLSMNVSLQSVHWGLIDDKSSLV